MPLISVIVPVFGDADSLEKCLRSIRQSTFPDFELLVGDDCSADAAGIARVSGQYGATLIRLDSNQGPGAARNAAASRSSGDILVFIDADVTVRPTTLEQIADRFGAESQLDSLIGSYDFCPANRGTVAAFRNLLHAQVHHRSSTHATTFWTGCGAMRRERFMALCGFDESRRMLEDVELGMRLRDAGGTLALDPHLEVTHHKEWTLWSMVRCDALDRAVPWTRLILEHGLPHDLNFRWQDQASTFVCALLPALIFISFRFGSLWWAFSSVALLAIVALQWTLFRFLARARGAGFALVSLPLYVVHSLSAAAGLVIGLWKWETSRDRRFSLAVSVLALLIFLGVQFAGGAHAAEFDAYPDEASHFMTGLMLRDFWVQWPLAHPISWAEQYYLHYPKVAFGHWPPLFHGIEGAWWLFLPPCRSSALLLIGLFGLIAAVAFYRQARELVHPLVALSAACLLIASPVFQLSISLVMADILTLVFGMLMIGSLASFCRRGEIRAFYAATGWCIACAAVKGTAICLIPALLLAPVLSGHSRVFRERAFWAPVALVLTAVLAWAWWFNPSLASVASWAGLDFDSAWPIADLQRLAGTGAVVVAAAGFLVAFRNRQPLAMTSASVVISAVLTSYFIRAMNEPRHWIIILPALLLLCLACLRWAWTLRPSLHAGAAILPAALVLALFPWQRYHQQAAGYRQIASSIPYPARVLISGSQGWLEGSWIVLGSLREPRPSSVFVRATKLISSSTWMGDHFRMRVNRPDAVEALLDRFGIEAVVLDEHLGGGVAPDYALLRETVSTRPEWKRTASQNGLAVYRRTAKLARATDPIQIDLGSNLGRVITEK
jgi:glycosyltransferase involved in cell wall biosynthesis